MPLTRRVLRVDPLLAKTLVLVAALMQAALGEAQVTTAITSSGLSTIVTPRANPTGSTTHEITGGTRSGQNLFHSFGLFSVGAGDTGKFLNSTPAITTKNILGRVTGGERSNIFGTINSSTYAGANLFLINPAGWIFGATASLNVAGSFYVSTADNIRFPDVDGQKVVFHADPTKPSVLSSASPIAFGFLGPTVAPISIEGSRLLVPNGQTLSIVGGDLRVVPSGTARPLLGALSGRIELASVASAGEATLGPAGDVDVTSFRDLGSIDMSMALISASGVPATPRGGTVRILGGRLVMDSSTIRVNTVGAEDGLQPGIQLQAREDIVLSNGTVVGTATSGGGKAGNVEVSGRNVSLRSGSVIRSQTSGAGQGGETIVRATDSIDVSGLDAGNNPSRIASEVLPGGTGTGGRVIVSAPSVALDGRGTISTLTLAGGPGGAVVVEAGRLSLTGDAEIRSGAASSGLGGDLTLTADSVTLSGGKSTRIFSSSVSEAQAAGDISLKARKITVTGGAQIQSGSLLQEAGDITVVASESIVVSEGSRVSSQAFAEKAGAVRISTPVLTVDDALVDTSTVGAGDAGDVFIEVGRLDLTRGGKIVSSSTVESSGRGGNVTITSRDSVSISGVSQTGKATTDFITDLRSGIFSNAEAEGAGGNITLTGRDVTLRNGATISATSAGTGDAGNIALVIADKLTLDGGIITTAAAQADGGTISITTTGSLVHLTDSEITTSVGTGEGKGGNITIRSELIVLDGSRIRADAFGGPGGNINIVADVFLIQDSRGMVPAKIGDVVTASSELSTQGTISIQAEITDVSGTLAQLPAALLEAAALLRASCAARLAGGKTSTLVVAGREGLPLEPGGLLPSPLLAEGPAGAGLSRSEGHQWETLAAHSYRLGSPSAVLDRWCSR